MRLPPPTELQRRGAESPPQHRWKYEFLIYLGVLEPRRVSLPLSKVVPPRNFLKALWPLCSLRLAAETTWIAYSLRALLNARQRDDDGNRRRRPSYCGEFPTLAYSVPNCRARTRRSAPLRLFRRPRERAGDPAIMRSEGDPREVSSKVAQKSLARIALR